MTEALKRCRPATRDVYQVTVKGRKAGAASTAIQEVETALLNFLSVLRGMGHEIEDPPFPTGASSDSEFSYSIRVSS